MNTINVRSILFRVAAVSLMVACASTAQAVSVHTHSHAHDAVAVQTTVDNDAGLFNASGDAPSTVPGAHAHAWASASVGFFNVTKRGSGHGWFADGNAPKHWWWHWTAGTGRFIVEGPAGESTDLQLVLPLPGQAGNDPMEPNDPSPIGPDPKQGFYADDSLTVGMDLMGGIAQGDNTQSLWRGTALLGGPNSANPGLQATGDLANVLRQNPTSENPMGISRNSAQVATELKSKTVRVRANEPFDLLLDLRAWSGAPPTDPIPEPPLLTVGNNRVFGTAANFVVNMALLNTSGRFTLRPIPEPSSAWLAILGLLGLALRARRR
jgi:hypothetical protein